MFRLLPALVLASSALVTIGAGSARADVCASYNGGDVHASTTTVVPPGATAAYGVSGAAGKAYRVAFVGTNARTGGIHLAVVGDESTPWITRSTFFVDHFVTPTSPYSTLCFEVRNFGTQPAVFEVATVASREAGCSTVAGVVACAALTAGTPVRSFSVPSVTVAPGAQHRVAGMIDLYRFELPNGGLVTLPCVVFGADTTTANPCAAAGGSFVNRVSLLLDQPVSEPVPTTGPPLATVRVCNAELVLTVNDIGITSFPAYTVC